MLKLILFSSLFCLGLAKPGLLDFLTGDDCEPIKDGSCAIVYDDEDCEKGDWDPLRIPADGKDISFSTLTLNPLKSLQNARYKNDIESLVVRKGCTLEVFKDSDCSGGKYTFRADKGQDLIVKELEDSDADDFDEDIECLRCSCDGGVNFNGQSSNSQTSRRNPNNPANCREIPAPYGAMAWDDSDCELDNWSEAVSLRPGEDKQWNLLADPVAYSTYANEIESLCVRRGCNLTVFDDGDFSDDPFSFVARDSDLCVTLDSPPSFYSVSERAQIKGLDDSIRSMILRCN